MVHTRHDATVYLCLFACCTFAGCLPGTLSLFAFWPCLSWLACCLLTEFVSHHLLLYRRAIVRLHSSFQATHHTFVAITPLFQPSAPGHHPTKMAFFHSHPNTLVLVASSFKAGKAFTATKTSTATKYQNKHSNVDYTSSSSSSSSSVSALCFRFCALAFVAEAAATHDHDQQSIFDVVALDAQASSINQRQHVMHMR